MRACERKNRVKDMYRKGRNWCWWGFKETCHHNLKSHLTWDQLRDIGEARGTVPLSEDTGFHPLKNPHICDRVSFGASEWSKAELHESRVWFLKHVKVYVLNLPTDWRRWNMIHERLRQLRIPVTRVLGVDMGEPVAFQNAKRAGWIPHTFDFGHAQKVALTPKHAMGPVKGTLGCAAAHFKAQSHVIADASPMAVIFEDDSWPADDFIAKLWSLTTRELPCDWDIVSLYSRCPYGTCLSPHLSRVEPDGNEPEWNCRHGVNWGMHGMFYRTPHLKRIQKLWKRAVFDAERPHCLDVDVALGSISNHVNFYAVPASQEPGFLHEMDLGSSRYVRNHPEFFGR